MRNEELDRMVKEGTRPSGKGARAGVKRDLREIGESRAVESVRGALVGSSGTPTERERKKSVKVVAPGEE